MSKTIKLNGRSKLALLASVGLLLFVVPQARADDNEKDPPTRVARISIVDGSVSMQPGGQGDWGSAERNRPVTIGDKIWVDKDSRAELQAGDSTFHLGSMTALSFLNLDQAITQVRLPEGSLNFRVRELHQGDVYEVDTPNIAFTIKQAGDFRVDVDESGDSSRIIVIRGEGQVTADGKTYEVHAGEKAEFNGAENPTYEIGKAPGPDGLDRWAEERDLKEDRSASGNYVSRNMPGYDDLDNNGTWSQEPDYGNVWYPNDVGPDWAPYSDGSWNWVDPWGWTWVGYEPWGFAPYHYGRWVFAGRGWGWAPGPFFGPPCYGPAFVGFLGGGFGFAFGFGAGFGWFPLGWGEPFFPWFHASGRFINVINVHNTFIRNVNVLNNRNFNFANAHNLRAVTTASRSAFTNGQRITRVNQHLTQSALNGARVTNSVGIRPSAHSTLGSSNFNSHVARPSSAVQDRAVMARTSPAAAASHSAVRTMNNRETSAGRFGNPQAAGSARANGGVNSSANEGMSARQRELSQERPPSARGNSNLSARNGASNNSAQRSANNSRSWEAQGNTTDRGRAPQGFGSDRSSNAPAQNSARARSDRPPWAGTGGPRGSSNSASSNSNRGNYSNGGRSYEPPQRNESYGNRGYSSPRTYSPPSRSYPAPSRSYSPPPSRSSSGGGGRSSSGGGGHSSGGGGSHGGGGGHGHR